MTELMKDSGTAAGGQVDIKVSSEMSLDIYVWAAESSPILKNNYSVPVEKRSKEESIDDTAGNKVWPSLQGKLKETEETEVKCQCHSLHELSPFFSFFWGGGGKEIRFMFLIQ